MKHVNKIRKQWLIALPFFFGVMPLASLCGCIYLLAKGNLDTTTFVVLSIGILISFALGYGLYRCSYLKKGTKLLTFITVLYIVQCLLIIMGRDINIWWYARLLAIGGLCTWWCVVSFRLMKANKQVAHTE
ncbi:MAG: hypothetical protein KDK50_02090 [Chlamydiia bacterium]|nr:hypothetical protein [Chlamydiia bacterium]